MKWLKKLFSKKEESNYKEEIVDLIPTHGFSDAKLDNQISPNELLVNSLGNHYTDVHPEIYAGVQPEDIEIASTEQQLEFVKGFQHLDVESNNDQAIQQAGLITYEDSEMYDVIRYQDPFPPDYIPNFDNPTDKDKEYFNHIILEPRSNGYSTYERQVKFYHIYSKMISDYLVTNPSDNIRILDVGCGTGELLKIIENISRETNRKFEYVGIDFNENMINLANYQFNDVGYLTHYEFRHLTMEVLSRITDIKRYYKYDLIFMNNVFDFKYEEITNSEYFNDYFVNGGIFQTNSNIEKVTTSGIIYNIVDAYYRLLIRQGGKLIVNFNSKEILEMLTPLGLEQSKKIYFQNKEKFPNLMEYLGGTIQLVENDLSSDIYVLGK